MTEENSNPNEEEQQLEDTGGEQETSVEESPEDSQEEVQEEVQEESQEEEEQEEAPQPSRREQLRVQQLLKKYGNPVASQPAPQTQAPNYRDMIDAPDEVYTQLEQTNQQFGQQQYKQGENAALQQINSVKWETTLNIDTPVVETEYPMLNPRDTTNFHPVLADTINQLYLKTVGYDNRTGMVANPYIRYREFVDGYMELADELASTKVATTTKNIAKQAANTGLRPDGSSAKRMNLNQPIENMSNAELKAYGKKLGLEPTK